MTDNIYSLHNERNRLYAARSSGLYCSDNNGQQWRPLYSELPTTAVAVNGSKLLAGVPGGILHSEDGGDRWELRLFPRPAPAISAILFTKNGAALASTIDDGIFYSADGGITWEPQNYGLLTSTVLSLLSMPSGMIFAGTVAGICRSRNQGRSWQQMNLTPLSVTCLAATCDNDLVVGTESTGLWLSTKRREAWQSLLDKGTPINQIHARDNTIIVITDNNLLISWDRGQMWSVQREFPQSVTAFAVTSQATNRVSLTLALHGDPNTWEEVFFR